MTPASSSGRPAARHRLLAVAALAGYLVLAVGMFSSVWRDPGHLTIGTTGDPELYMWMLGWAPFALTHLQNPFLTDYLNYPDGANMMWQGMPAMLGLAASPLVTAVGPVATYDVLITVGVGASAWCAYLAFLRIIGGQVASAVGGLLYGFSPYMVAHSAGHVNFVWCVFPPLVLVLLHDLFVGRQNRPHLIGLALGVLATFQLLTGEEILATTTLCAVLGVGILVVLHRPGAPVVRRAAIGLGLGATTFLLLSAVPLAYQFLGPQVVLGAVRSPGAFVTDLLNFVVPTEVQLLVPSGAIALTHRFSGNASEWNGYVGVPLLLLLAFIVWTWRRQPLVRWTALLSVAVAVLSLGPRLHVAGAVTPVRLPWAVVQRLPVLQDILPGRLMLYFFLLSGLLLAFFVARLPAGRKRVAGGGAIAVALIPLLPFHFPAPSNPVPHFFTSAEVQRIPEGSVALVAPFSADPGGSQSEAAISESTHAMLWQLSSGMRFRMPEGYVRLPGPNHDVINGPLPSTTQTVMLGIQEGGRAPELTAGLRAQIGGDFARWRVRTVIVGPMENQAEMVRFFTQLLGQQPEPDGGVLIWWNASVRSG